ncbi:MAG: hypothetical protein LKM41_12650 [Lachnospiraceae bacterium]|jgi:hypothetical protein|nr:hypothetical protein [Lachnospiraceae bacterium]
MADQKTKLSNGAIYRRTFCFSWARLLLQVICLVILFASGAVGFLVSGQKAVGLGIGALVGIVIWIILNHFLGYLLKAGQIAMMTKGVTEDELPEHVFQAGKQAVKENFLTVAAYYAVTGIIGGIFHEITRGINALGKMGGSGGTEVADTISSVIQVVVSYLEECCLGYVFFKHGQQNAFKSTCDGAVLFFKNWKALLKNLGRIFGLGLVSLIIIGGALAVGAYNILGRFPEAVSAISQAIHEAYKDIDVSDPTVALVVSSILIAVVIWSILHSVFVRPFVLVGVLRNYMQAGVANPPQEESYGELEKLSPKFAKAHAKAVM